MHIYIFVTKPIMEAFKFPSIKTLFWYAKNGNRIFWNSSCSFIYL